MNENARQTTWLWRVMLAFMLGTGVMASAPVASPARDNVPLDLAALILHSDDLDWLLEKMGLMVGNGYPYGQQYSTSHTSIEEAVRHDVYALGRGGFSLQQMGEQEAAELLVEAGWVRAQSAMLSIPEAGKEGFWSHAVAITIEEFSTAEGAEMAMSNFDDADMLEELTLASSVNQIDPALEANDANTLAWELVTSRYDGQTNVATLWAQVDTFVVSVALMHGHGYEAPDPTLLPPLVEVQLKRLEFAEYLYQPGLPNCAPEFRQVEAYDTRAEYTVLNGKALAGVNDTFTDLQVAQVDVVETGLVDSYMVNQSIDETAIGAYDGTMWFRSRLHTFTSEDSAAEYLAGTAERLENDSANYSNVEQLDDDPAFGDGIVLFNYDGSENYAATIIYVQFENEVFSLRLGSMTDYQPDAAIELAEAQLDRLDDGGCDDPLEVPRSLLDSIELPYRQTSQINGST